jgi:hypothetical protein
MSKPPIFIHSLFRAGSTYLFNVFRRSLAGYWCYQEPLHEVALFARSVPEQLLRGFGEKEMRLNRHPKMDVPYFQELYDTWPAWKDALGASAIYNGYFAPAGADIGITYWQALIEAANGRPVFQECRTSGRIDVIRQHLGGYHIYLWRNPWDQWWSYKVTPYFDVANQLIINAPNPPPAVHKLRTALGFSTHEYDDLGEAFAHFGAKHLTSEESYLMFYLLWCLGLKAGIQHADLAMNIDRLSDLPIYRGEIQSNLESAGIGGIDFSDCQIPQGIYLEQDKAFFTALEDKVHLWLTEGGWSQDEINHVLALRQQFQPTSWSELVEVLNPRDMAEQSSRARTLARRFETTAAVRVREDAAKIVSVEVRAEEAEAALETTRKDLDEVHQTNHNHWLQLEATRKELFDLHQANQNHQQSIEARQQQVETESRVKQAELELRAAVSESRVREVEAESRAKQAEVELRAEVSESRVREVEAKSRAKQAELELRAEVSESRVREVEAESMAKQAELELRAEVSESRVREVEAESRAMQAEFELRAEVSESRAWELEVRATEAEACAQQEGERVVQAELRALLLESRLQQTETESRAKQAELELRANQADTDLQATRKELHGVHQANHNHWLLLEATRKELHEVHQANHYHYQLAEARQQQIQALQGSYFWRITAPMRWIADFRLRRRGASAVPPAPTFLNGMIRWGMAQPKLVNFVRATLRLLPSLHKRLAWRVEQAMVSQHTTHLESQPTICAANHVEESVSVELTPGARQIYTDLKAAIERRQREQA